MAELTPYHFLEKEWVAGFKYKEVSDTVNFIFLTFIEKWWGVNSRK